MISFNKDINLFTNPHDFGHLVNILDENSKVTHCFSALFNYKSKEESSKTFDSITRYPELNCSASETINLTEGVHLIIKGNGEVDRIFKVRGQPHYSLDSRMMTVELMDITEDGKDGGKDDSSTNKYIP